MCLCLLLPNIYLEEACMPTRVTSLICTPSFGTDYLFKKIRNHTIVFHILKNRSGQTDNLFWIDFPILKNGIISVCPNRPGYNSYFIQRFMDHLVVTLLLVLNKFNPIYKVHIIIFRIRVIVRDCILNLAG